MIENHIVIRIANPSAKMIVDALAGTTVPEVRKIVAEGLAISENDIDVIIDPVLK